MLNEPLKDQTSSAFSIPELPQNLPGTFWGLTTFYNPAGYGNKKENYIRFRETSKNQGLNLLAVELVFGNAGFELNEHDADILIQLRVANNCVLWQKEALLNVGLKNLPKDCDKIAWIDCDILFKNDHWIEDTCDLLEKYVVVQPFSHATRLWPEQWNIDDCRELSDGLKEERCYMGWAII